ncbi:MAG: SIS domain-containing protein [Bacteroidia bacterium]
MMHTWLYQQPQQWKETLTSPFPDLVFPKPVANVCVVGMGGSAFGAEVVQRLVHNELQVPFVIYRGYELPAWVGESTLVIASSYSGTTEETLIATQEAQTRKAMIVTLSSGGELPQKANVGHVALPSGLVPRMAALYSIAAQLRVLHKANLLSDEFYQKVQESTKSLEDFVASPPELKSLAEKVKASPIAFYALEGYEPIALRARQQLQENAKHVCWHHIIPEMNHNEILALEFPPQVVENLFVIFVYGSHTHPRNLLRLQFMKELLRQKGVRYEEISPPPSSVVGEMLILLWMVDALSLSLAAAHSVDAQSIPTIDALKAYLKKP